MKAVERLHIKTFADGADKAGMLEMYAQPFVMGLTTNPTLMRKAGIQDYKAFAHDILSEIKDKPVLLNNLVLMPNYSKPFTLETKNRNNFYSRKYIIILIAT